MKYLHYILAALLLLPVGATMVFADDDKETDSTKQSIQDLENELKRPAKKDDGTIGNEALKPITEIDPKELIRQISKRMEQSEIDILSAKADGSVGGLQAEVVQGLNRLHSDIIRDVNKTIDWAKMFKKSDDPSKSSSKSDGEVQKEDPSEKSESQENKDQPSSAQPQPNAGQPAVQPYDASGGDFIDDIQRVDGSAADWGHLPPKDRADIEHAHTVGKIPRYREFIEDYMKSLNKKD